MHARLAADSFEYLGEKAEGKPITTGAGAGLADVVALGGGAAGAGSLVLASAPHSAFRKSFHFMPSRVSAAGSGQSRSVGVVGWRGGARSVGRCHPRGVFGRSVHFQSRPRRRAGNADAQRAGSLTLPSRQNYQQKTDDGDAAAVIDPPGLADHEARSGIGKIARALPHKDQSRERKSQTDERQQRSHGFHRPARIMTRSPC